MRRRFVRADGFYMTIDIEECKRSMLMLHRPDGTMAHLQFLDDIEWQVEQIRKEGFEEAH